jgi:hypothetical protein
VRWGTAIIAAVGCAALAVGAALSYSANRPVRPPTSAAAPAPAVPVVAAAVKSGAVPIYLHGIGTVDAWNTVVVRSQIQGPLIRIAFKEGQMVHKGDLLAEIDPRPYQAQLDQAIANRERDQANLQNAELDLKRYATLLPNQLTVSQQQYDTQNTTVAQLKAAVKADEAAIETARIDLSYTRLTAPIDGVTGISVPPLPSSARSRWQQWFERLGAERWEIIVAGLTIVAFAIALWRYPRSRSSRYRHRLSPKPDATRCASQSLRGPSAHECITRLQAYCGSHDPQEDETGLHTAQFWTPDNTPAREGLCGQRP